MAHSQAGPLYAFFGWWFALYPGFAVVGATVLPPDPFTQLLVVVPAHVVATLAATAAFRRRRGSPRQLLRYAVAVYVLVVAVGVAASLVLGGVDVLLGGLGEPARSTAVRAVGAVGVVAVAYVGGYLLVYEGWYGRLAEGLSDGDAPE